MNNMKRNSSSGGSRRGSLIAVGVQRKLFAITAMFAAVVTVVAGMVMSLDVPRGNLRILSPIMSIRAVFRVLAILRTVLITIFRSVTPPPPIIPVTDRLPLRRQLPTFMFSLSTGQSEARPSNPAII